MSAICLTFVANYKVIMKHLFRYIQIVFLFCLVMIPASICAEVRQHQVSPGETLYSISRRYGVTVEQLQAANPTIQGTNVPSGMTLLIPDSNTTAAKVTVSAVYGEPDKPKKQEAEASTALPVSTSVAHKQSPAAGQAPVQSGNAQTQTKAPASVISVEEYQRRFGGGAIVGSRSNPTIDNIAVIMPFNLHASNSEQEKSQMRAVELYEGILLAVNEAQAHSYRHIHLQTYDTGSEPLSSILANPELKNASLIIAPIDQRDVEPVAAFAEANGIPVVSLFAFNANWIRQYPHLYQLNTAKTMLYPQLIQDILGRFSNYSFVFVADSTSMSKADPLAEELRKAAQARNIKCYDYGFINPEGLSRADSVLQLATSDILYVPVTPNRDALRRLFPGLKTQQSNRTLRYEESVSKLKGNEIEAKPLKMAVLGFPEWQLYTQDFVEYYYDLNVYMFSKIYVNPFDVEVQLFYNDFKYWYGKDLMQLFPRYGLVGYDVASFFLKAMGRHGHNFAEKVVGEPGKTLQTVINFSHKEGEGYVNQGLYLVHFTPETKIEKYVIR